jgi:hypothetical protein
VPLPAPTPTASATNIWSTSTTPSVPQVNDPTSVELGVKFRADVAGSITGIRFYKGFGNNGTHTGSLWTNTGTLLATGTFTSETASGWQQLNFTTPVVIAPFTTYIASYHTTTGYAADRGYFINAGGADSPPLHALAWGIDNGNGLGGYGPAGTFPSSANGTNYWVDIVFSTSTTAPPPPPPAPTPAPPTPAPTPSAVGQTIWSSSAVPAVQQVNDPAPTELGVKFLADAAGSITGIRFYKGLGNNGTHTGSLWSNTGTLLATGTFTGESASGWQQLTFTTPVTIAANTTYVASYHTTTGYAVDRGYYFYVGGVDNPPLHALAWGVASGNGLANYGPVGTFPSSANGGNYWVDVVFLSSTTTAPPAPASSTTIWSSSAVPAVQQVNDPTPAELGVKFRADTTGSITGIRFYKGLGNNGTHTGSLWNSTGTLLATGTFTGETANGWQQLTFATPVTIAANTTYIASYHTTTGYAVDRGYFFYVGGVDNPPLHALAWGVAGGNGLGTYGPPGTFPTDARGTNYWVDVLFQ